MTSSHIGFWFFPLLIVNCIVNIEASSSVNKTYRTGYHFQPLKNWMNDPNGPMIYRGVYHLFYQWNPKGAVSTKKVVWGHATSTDLINWTHHYPAIKPSRPFDINGCWSGSVTILPDGKPVILYTGINPKKEQVQNIAEPKDLSDPYLREWTKSPLNPLMAPSPVNGINASSFRDPTTAWLGQDKKWRVVIGSMIHRRGLAITYTSKDFLKWEKSLEPLHYDDGSGMWECPDFFPVMRFGSKGVETSSFGEPNEILKHVLKISFDDTRHDHYTIGTYDRVKDKFVPDNGFKMDVTAPRYDYGKYYASKTFYDSAKKRRVLWGWINESSLPIDDVKKGWSGVQAIPRKIWLDRSGQQLVQWPVREIERLRTEKVILRNIILNSTSRLEVYGVTAAQADVEVWFKVRGLENADVIEPSWTDPQFICSQTNLSVKSGFGPFGLLLLASKNLEEYTAVYFKIFKAGQNGNKYIVVMCSDQTRFSLAKHNDKTTYGAFVDISPHQPISLRTLIDHSIVESFGGKGRACITPRVYPKLAIGTDSHLFAFNYGYQSVEILSLNAWSMKASF